MRLIRPFLLFLLALEAVSDFVVFLFSVSHRKAFLSNVRPVKRPPNFFVLSFFYHDHLDIYDSLDLGQCFFRFPFFESLRFTFIQEPAPMFFSKDKAIAAKTDLLFRRCGDFRCVPLSSRRAECVPMSGFNEWLGCCFSFSHICRAPPNPELVLPVRHWADWPLFLGQKVKVSSFFFLYCRVRVMIHGPPQGDPVDVWWSSMWSFCELVFST